MKKPKILLLSDLWGVEKSDWIVFYTDFLANYFEVVCYDSCLLGEIDGSSEKSRHEQFVTGGVERAVSSLLALEHQPVVILGFSIGGYIGWKATLKGLSVLNLFAISSTRLRVESQKPATNITLIYGAEDQYIPNDNWFQQMDMLKKIYPNEAHNFYQKREIAAEICRLIIEKIGFS